MKLKIRIKAQKWEPGWRNRMTALAISPLARFGLLASCLVSAGATQALAQEQALQGHQPRLAQVVALDECDPSTL
jgi:hypothetical protein